MKIPMILNKGNKRYSFIQKCNENLFLYQDQFGFKETFTRFDLKGIDNTEIDKLIKRPYNIVPKGVAVQQTRIILYDTKKFRKKVFKTTKDVAEELEMSTAYINTIIQRNVLLKKRYKIERIPKSKVEGAEGKWEFIEKEKIC